MAFKQDKIAVVCFYWQGDRWQDKDYVIPEGHKNYQASILPKLDRVSERMAARYVDNLYRGVKRFADREFDFILYTNEPLQLEQMEIDVRPLKMVTDQGVLPRLYMFSEEAGLFGRQVLCLDLDVVVVGNLSKIMGYDGLFCTRTKFNPNDACKIDGDIMSFQAGEETEGMFWKPFIQDIATAENLTRGRERYWIRHILGDDADTWDIIAPGAVVSYKWHVKGKNSVPRGASIVSCHGYPRPHQIKEHWIKNYWK